MRRDAPACYGAIEAGGTKFVLGYGDGATIAETATIPTGDADVTLRAVENFFADAAGRHGAVVAIGIGSFGPLDLNPASPGYGRITSTPKLGWRDVDMPARLHARFAVPVAIDTDVNAAALAEARARQVDRLAYVTVGTGIGVGLVLDGVCQAGFGHPEGGHIPVRRAVAHGDFAGICPFHRDCLEGLASGPAMAAAWGSTADRLPSDHVAWDVEASYLGQLCATLILTTAPQRIVLGGGVMQRADLLARVRIATLATLGGYCEHWDDEAVKERIVAPACVHPPGLLGAFLLAERAASKGPAR